MFFYITINHLISRAQVSSWTCLILSLRHFCFWNLSLSRLSYKKLSLSQSNFGKEIWHHSMFMYSTFCPVVILLQVRCWDCNLRGIFLYLFSPCKEMTLALKVAHFEGKLNGPEITPLKINYYQKLQLFEL